MVVDRPDASQKGWPCMVLPSSSKVRAERVRLKVMEIKEMESSEPAVLRQIGMAQTQQLEISRVSLPSLAHGELLVSAWEKDQRDERMVRS